MSLHFTHDSVLGSHTFFLPLLSNCFHCRFAYSEGGLWDLRVDRSIGTAVRNKSWIIMFGIVSLLARSDHNRVDRCLCIRVFIFMIVTIGLNVFTCAMFIQHVVFVLFSEPWLKAIVGL